MKTGAIDKFLNRFVRQESRMDPEKSRAINAAAKRNIPAAIKAVQVYFPEEVAKMRPDVAAELVRPMAYMAAVLADGATVSGEEDFAANLRNLVVEKNIRKIVEVGTRHGKALMILRCVLGADSVGFVDLVGVDQEADLTQHDRLLAYNVELIKGDASGLVSVIGEGSSDVVFAQGLRTTNDVTLPFNWFRFQFMGEYEELAREFDLTHTIALEMTRVLRPVPHSFAMQLGQGDRVVLDDARLAGFSTVLSWGKTIKDSTPPELLAMAASAVPLWVDQVFTSATECAVWKRPA
ncbi:MAG: hypothetical protein NT099_03530 [Candidatus Saganbacteria bacterium]|nr:hypothetical protein [Candidatus Saganbacteria bacterium]